VVVLWREKEIQTEQLFVLLWKAEKANIKEINCADKLKEKSKRPEMLR